MESRVESGDVGPDLKQFIGEGFFEDRDVFVGVLVKEVEQDQEKVALMSVLLGAMLDLCATDDPLPIEALDIDDAEIELLLGQFHDCLGSDRELRASFLAQGNGEVASGYLEYLLRGCRQFKNIGLLASVSVISAKAGTQNPVAGKYAFAANGLWIPAFAGMTVNMTTPPSVSQKMRCSHRSHTTPPPSPS